MLQNPACRVFFVVTINLQMNEKALTSVFVELRKKTLRFATRFFPSEEDADDALQEAFCRLWTRRDSIDSTSEAEALMKTTVRNMGIDAYRRRNTLPMVSLNPDIDITTEEIDGGDENQEERFKAIERIIMAQLTDNQREIFMMKEFKGYSFSQIAKELNMQEPAVRMQLSTARKSRREVYNKQL